MKRIALCAILTSLLASFAIADEHEDTEPGFNESTFKGLELRSIGPAFMSGRIADIAIHPDEQSTWYVAVGSGGVWKTQNRGTTWEPIFDNEDSYSIGCVTIDPNNPNTVWIGTGENVSGRHVGYGSGVYRSRDGGQNWENMGLESSHLPAGARQDTTRFQWQNTLATHPLGHSRIVPRQSGQLAATRLSATCIGGISFYWVCK